MMQNVSEKKNCQNCKSDFVIEPEDFSFYEKIGVSAPTFCPDCRNQRRMSWRNERSLHRIKCSAPGHDEYVISMYDPKKSYVVYDNKYWWSDEWDPCQYGKEYDFSKNFFKQFSELLSKIPLAALSTINSVNSEYTNFVDGNKNCYLIFGSGWNENMHYGNKLFMCKDSMDLLMCTKCELSYESEGCSECYHILFSRNSKNCTDSYFLYNCRNCQNCFGCANLVNKSYCIWNKQYTKEEYDKKIREFKIDSYQNLNSIKERFKKEIYLKSVHRFANIFSSLNCTGNNINSSKNCKNCFDIYENTENSKYLYSALDLKDSVDGNGIFKNELLYECVDCNYGSRNLCDIIAYDAEHISYGFNCHSVENCFGCVGLRKKKYCILNKQYTEKEYKELMPRIKEHMDSVPFTDKKGRVYKYGDFFPIELSPFAYNETIAQEYFPLNEKECTESGFEWKKEEKRNYQIDINSRELPDSIKKVNEDLLNKTIGCEHKGKCNEQCTEAFKITQEELKFYKRMNLPLPRLCPNCRHYSRLKKRNPLHLWHRQCMCEKEGHGHSGKCPNEFETSYSPDRPEIVYCEQCYQKEVY